MFKGGMFDIFQQAKQLNEEMAKFQVEMERLQFEGSAGAGMVTVKMSGKQELVSVIIDPSILKSENQQLVQDLVMGATNEALKASKEGMAEAMKSRLGQMGGMGALAGLFGGMK